MNIIYIDHYAGSISMGMEFRPYYFSSEWIKNGNNVRIIAANYSHLRKNNPTVLKDFEIQNIDGVNYQFVKTIEYRNNGIKRAITMFQFCIKLWLNAKKIAHQFRPDVVIASSTYPLDAFPAKKISKISKCKYIHETHDLWPLTLIEVGGMKKTNPFVLMMSLSERYAYSRSDKVVGLFPNASEYMVEHGLQNKNKYVCIPNGISVSEWNREDSIPNDYKKIINKLKKENRTIVAYVGGHSISNALEYLIDAGKKLKYEENISILLVGDGIEKKNLIKRANGSRNIIFLPRIDKKYVPSLLEKSDILYVGGRNNNLYKYGISLNKIYDYMMAGKPIISGFNAYNDDIKENKCGISIDPENSEQIIEAIRTIKNMNIDKIEKMGSNGRKAVLKKYNYSNLSKQFINEINDL